MNTHKSVPLKIKPTSQDKQTGTKAKLKPTKRAEAFEAFQLAKLGLQLHRINLSKLHCKPSREDWLNTPAEDKIAYAVIVVMEPPDGGAGHEEVQLTQAEHIELKAHLAFLRGIRPKDSK
jgi:hypothetical protein